MGVDEQDSVISYDPVYEGKPRREGKMRVYIAGPMRGIEDLNKSAFMEAEERLLRRGCAVMNPHRDVKLYLDLKEIVRLDMMELLSCDAIYMLKGWRSSIGATAEHAVAVFAKMTVIFEKGA